MNKRELRFGIQTGQQFATWEEILTLWLRAEALGHDSAWNYDHFVAVMMDPLDPTLEAWTTLAALATATSRIRIGTLVTGNTYRHPAILAKMATTLDILSGGRLEFGIGAGWYEPEHKMYGIPFDTARRRCERLDEALQVIRLLWREQYASFSGEYYRLEDAIHEPKPVQTPHPPIVVAGSGEKRLLPIVARHADHWTSFGSPAVYRKKIEVLARLCREAGRDVDRIEKSVLIPAAITDDPEMVKLMVEGYAEYQNLSPEEAREWMLLGSADEVCAQIETYADAGVTHFILTVTPYNPEIVEDFARQVMPAFR